MYKYIPTYGSRFKMFWNSIPPPSQNGIIIGYIIFYQMTSVVANSSVEDVLFSNITTMQVADEPLPSSLELFNLGLKTNYTVRIAGITSKGIGAYSGIFYAETGEYRKYTILKNYSFASFLFGKHL